MIRAILLFLGLLVATCGLYVLLVVLECYWNLYDWQPQLDSSALGLGFGICLALIGIWWVACASHQCAVRGVSLVVCLALLALAVYVLPPEPLNSGLFARKQSSPLWYRAGRLLVLASPTMFWVLGLLQQRKAAGHGESQHRLGRMV